MLKSNSRPLHRRLSVGRLPWSPDTYGAIDSVFDRSVRHLLEVGEGHRLGELTAQTCWSTERSNSGRGSCKALRHQAPTFLECEPSYRALIGMAVAAWTPEPGRVEDVYGVAASQVYVCKIDDVSVGRVAVFNDHGTLYALSDTCSHATASLADAEVKDCRQSARCTGPVPTYDR